MPKRHSRDKFPIMWKVLLLFLIGLNFDCGLTSDIDDNPGYRNDDGLPEEAIDDGNYPTTVQLSNGELTRECNDNTDSQSSKQPNASKNHGRSLNNPTNKRKNFDNFSYIKTIRNPQHSSQISEYDKSFHSLNDYELNDEDYQIPRPRKRRPPEHYEYPFVSTSPPPQLNPKQNNYKGNSLRHINQMSENSELKSLLKMQQFSGFSLSEILQQRNLSLSDLLKGKTEVISALRASDNADDEIETSREDNKVVVTVKTPRLIEYAPDNDEKPDKSEDFSLKIPTSTLINSTTTTTTVKSSEDEEIMEFSDFRKRNERPETIVNNIEKFHRDMDSILNIQNVLTSTEFTLVVSTTNEAEDMNTVTKSGDLVLDSIDVEYQNEEPTNNNDFIENYQSEKIIDELSPVNHRIFKPKSKIYEEILLEIEPEARAEILELFSSSATAEKLEELLRSRNMSLEELIALRQRGSSQLHLAQVKTAKLDSQRNKLPKDEDILSEHTTERQTTTENTGKYQENEPMIIDLTSGKFLKDDDDDNDDEKSKKKSIQLVDLLSAFESFPFTVGNTWPEKTLGRNDDFKVNNSLEKIAETEESKINYSSTTDSEFKVFEEINDNVEVTTNKNVENVNENSFEITNNEDSKTLSRIRPSIIASGTILGMALLSFLLVFVVLRIRQKQKFTYGNTFPRTVFQVPVMNSRKLSNSSSNTIMINVVATSTAKKPVKREMEETNNDSYDYKSDIENDSLDADDSWDTIPDFMK